MSFSKQISGEQYFHLSILQWVVCVNIKRFKVHSEYTSLWCWWRPCNYPIVSTFRKVCRRKYAFCITITNTRLWTTRKNWYLELDRNNEWKVEEVYIQVLTWLEYQIFLTSNIVLYFHLSNSYKTIKNLITHCVFFDVLQVKCVSVKLPKN